MNRLPIIALVGLVGLEACSASDDLAERPVDAGADVKPTARPDVRGADQLDASGESTDDVSTPDPDVAEPDTIFPPPDSAAPPDATTGPDRTLPPQPDAPRPPDVTPDHTITSCLVTFTVRGVQWDAPEGGADAQAARVVRLVGDAANIGSWAPTAGVLLTETLPGTWSGMATFDDQQLTEFKFVKLDGLTPEWESWLPFDSNRSLRVECVGDGGVVADAADVGVDRDAFTAVDGPSDRAADSDGAAIDAAADAASADAVDGGSAEGGALDANADVQDAGAMGDGRVTPVPARGRVYAGDFGVRPPDATK
ncbi:MAG TPA: carbohydrate-binding module family 20 domain-containing protein [Polyangiaceae bacterium]|nr:carbohydrate-binding module family 20 domain-containing protein [Polyangiaceae bacterium]